MNPTNEAGHGLPEVAAAREVIRAYFAGELDDTMILNLSESLALSRGVPEGWRVSNADRGRAGDGWEVYAPDGSGGVVSKYDVKDWIVRDLLNALAAAHAAAGAQGEDVLSFGDVTTRFIDGMGWVVACSDAIKYVDALRLSVAEAFSGKEV